MEDSLRIARRSGNPLAVLQPLSSLGDYACYQEEYRSALNNFEECLGIAIQAGNHFHRAIQHNNIGTVQHMLGNYGDADENYRDSLQLCRRIGYLEGEAVALGNLGEIMVIQSQFSAAIEYFERSLSIARQIENPRTIAVALNNLGEIYRVLGQLERAGQYFIAGLQGAWEKKVISQVLESLTGLGILLINGEQKWLGQSCLSLVCSHASTEPDDRMRAQKHLGEIGEREGDLLSLEEIVAAVMQACEAANSLAIYPEQPAVRPQPDGD
jgi:tetratricopeptide (TPR) repeat protein